MDMKRAKELVGNQDTISLRNMVKALNTLPALNTPEDEERLAAAQYIIKARNNALKRSMLKDYTIN